MNWKFQMQTVLLEGVLRGDLGILDMGIHLEHFGEIFDNFIFSFDK